MKEIELIQEKIEEYENRRESLSVKINVLGRSLLVFYNVSQNKLHWI